MAYFEEFNDPTQPPVDVPGYRNILRSDGVWMRVPIKGVGSSATSDIGLQNALRTTGRVPANLGGNPYQPADNFLALPSTSSYVPPQPKFSFRPTSASAGQGLYNLPVNTLSPVSGQPIALGGQALNPYQAYAAQRNGLFSNYIQQSQQAGLQITQARNAYLAQQAAASGVGNKTYFYNRLAGNPLGGGGSPFNAIPQGGLQGNLFAPNNGYANVATPPPPARINVLPNTGNVFYAGQNGVATKPSLSVKLSQILNNPGVASARSAYLAAQPALNSVFRTIGLGAAAFNDPTFNENVLVPSVAGGLTSKFLQTSVLTPTFQALGKANVLGFSRAGAGLAGIRPGTTLYKNQVFRGNLPGFAGVTSLVAGGNAARSLFSTDINQVKYGQSALGAVIGSDLGGAAFGGLGALSGNPFIAGAAGITGSLAGGALGAAYGNALPVDAQLYKVADASLATQGKGNEGVFGGLSPLLTRPDNILQKLSEPLALALDASFIAGPITDYPKRLAGLATRGDVQSTLGQLSLDARTGIGSFQNSGLNVASRFARVAFAQGEGLGGNNPLFREQGVGGYNTRNSLAEAVEGVSKDLFSTLKDQKFSNKQIASYQLQYQQEVGELYKIQAGSLQNLAQQQQIEANRPFFNSAPSLINQNIRPVAAPGGGVQYRLDPAVNKAQAAQLRKIPAVLSNNKPGLVESALSAIGLPDQGRAISRFFANIGQNNYHAVAGLSQNSVFSDIKRYVGTQEAQKTQSFANRAFSISQNAARTVQIAQANQGANGQGGGLSAYQAYRIRRDQIQDARYALGQAEKGYESGGRLLAAKTDEAFSKIDFPELTGPQINYHGYNADLPAPGTVSLEEFRKAQAASAQKNIIDDITQQRSDAYAASQPALEQYGALKSAATSAYSKYESKAPSATAAANVTATLTENLARMEKSVQSLTKTLGKYDTAQADLTKTTQKLNDTSESLYVRNSFSNTAGDIRSLEYSGIGLQRQGILQEKYQLSQEQQLGALSKGKYIRADFEQQRQDIALQTRQFNIEKDFRTAEAKRLSSIAESPAATDQEKQAAIDYQSATNRYIATNQAQLDQLNERFSTKNEDREVGIIARTQLSTAVQPYITSILAGANTGTSPLAGIQKAAQADLTGLASSAAGDFLFAKSPVLKSLFQGGLKDLPGNLSSALGSRVGPVGPIQRFNGNFGSYNKVNSALGAGYVGYTASQYIANAVSPYNNGTVGSLGSVAGGLIGTAFGGPVGSLLGSAAGGLIGALPFTQGPVGGALSGVAAGAAAGSFFGLPGALLGGALGGLLGLGGGFQSKQKKAQDDLTKQQAAQQAAQLLQQQQAQGRNFAKTDINKLGPDLAGDLFSGYGNFQDKLGSLNNYLSPGAFYGRTLDQGLSPDALTAAQGEFGRLSQYFNPVIGLANRYSGVLSRPGGFEGQLYDIGLQQQLGVAQKGNNAGQLQQLTGVFGDIQSNLGKYGFDSQRASLAGKLFSQTYQNQLQALDLNIQDAQRGFQDTNDQIQINQASRGINRDVLTRQLSQYDQNSQQDIEQALGTLQRRENRAAVVSKLKSDQAFNKDILTRQFDVFNQSDTLQTRQEFYQQQDAAQNVDNLQQSRKILTEGFGELAPKLTDASDQFYQMTEAIKQVNQQLEQLSRNLR